MASQKRQAPYDGLSPRAIEILGLLAEGMSDREIAERLVMTINTVKWYNRQIYSILGVGSRTQAIVRARELQLLDEGNGSTAPALTIRRPSRHNLPVETTQFIGRKHEIELLLNLLDTSHLLTLVGPPGTGKTRLALQVAWEVADTFQDGAFFVSLAPINNPALVTNTIAGVMGVNETQEQPLLETLKHVLRESRTLLVLDNFEHLLPAATQVSELLSAAPGLKVLATSREPLHLYGEQEYAVPPLALPDSENLDLAALADCESTALFMQQARAVRPSFALTAENAPDIAQICVRLEGLPLAIELAAARTKLLTPRTLLARLVSRLDTLTGGAKDLPARQQTLHNTIEWSYNLLNEGEKMLFARLAVFRGDFSMEAVETICCEALPIDVFDGLESLVNKSLVQQKELPDGELRFTMLEMLHEYAWERLMETPSYAEIAERHSLYYRELVTSHERDLFSMEPQAAVTAIRHDLDNVRRAWHWTVERVTAEPTSPTGIHIFIDGLAAFYEVASLFEEGQGTFIRAAEEVAGGSPEMETVRCHLLARVAEFSEWRGEGERAYALAEQVVELAEQPDSSWPNRLRQAMRRYRADALRILGILGRERNVTERSIQYLKEAITIYQMLELERPLAITYDWLGLLCSDLRRLDEAMDYLGQAAALYAETGNERGAVFNKGMTAIVLYVGGRLEESAAYQREVLAGYERLRYPIGVARTANNLALVLLELGQLEEAVEQFEHALQIFLQVGDLLGFYNSLGNKGEIHLALDEFDEARHCFQQIVEYFHETDSHLINSENLWRLGWLLIDIGDYEQAQTALEKCIVLSPIEENPEFFAIAHGLLAVAAWQLGNIPQALAHFDRAAEALENVRRYLTVARFAMLPRAALLLERGEIEAAETILAELRPFLEEAGSSPTVVESRLLQARITAARRAPAEARQQLAQLLALDLRPAEQAAVHYEIWHLAHDQEHGRLALNLYQQLAARSPRLIYHQHLAHLRAALLLV